MQTQLQIVCDGTKDQISIYNNGSCGLAQADFTAQQLSGVS